MLSEIRRCGEGEPMCFASFVVPRRKRPPTRSEEKREEEGQVACIGGALARSGVGTSPPIGSGGSS